MPPINGAATSTQPSPALDETPTSRRKSQNRNGLNLGSFRQYQEKDESLSEWRTFLAKYAAGAFSPSEQPPLPALSSKLTFTSPLGTKDDGPSGFPFHGGQPRTTIAPTDVAGNSGSPRGDGRREATDTKQAENELPPNAGSDFDHPVYESVEITPLIAKRVRDFYLRHAYLPPPRAPLEVLREQIVKEYDLYSDEQMHNIQAAIDLVQAYLGGICTFSLFRNNVQVIMGVSGRTEVIEALGLHVGQRLLPETSLCGHSVLLAATSKPLYIPDLSKDWRYTGNPYADKNKGVKTYIGATVSLNVDPASPNSDQVVSVGVINSMHLDGVLPSLTPEQSRVIDSISRFLTEILRATWEGLRRTREARSRLVVSDFLDHIMLPRLPKSSAITPTQQLRWHLGKADDYDPERRPSLDTASTGSDLVMLPAQLSRTQSRDAALAQRPRLSPEGLSSGGGSQTEDEGELKKDVLERDAAILVKEVRNVLLEADGAAVVDLRSLHAFKDARGGIKYVMDPESMHSLNTVAWDHSHTTTERPDFLAPEARKALMQTLYMQQHDPESSFVLKDNKTSGLEPYLPPSTCSHLIIPFMAGDQPLFSIIITSSAKYWSFRLSDADFVRTMGVILRAQVLQNRVVEADMAKTTFLSSISHELRTPLHGLMSGLQLFEEAIESEDLGQAADLLPIIKNSGYALQNILNDMLQFGQLAHDNSKNKLSDVDLGEMVMSAVKTCIPRYFSWHKGTSTDVKICVEYEDRDWAAKIDESGLQRILFNGITNAMKVTKSGNIKVSLVTSSTANGVTLQIVDTGPGIDPKFASKLFQPFSKADSFNPGAGLGLYITKALVERMSGSISLHSTPGSQGATFEVNLPVTLVSPIERNGAGRKMVRHEIDMVAAEKYHWRSERQTTVEPGSQEPSGNPSQESKVESPATTAPIPVPEPEQPPIPTSESLRVLVVDDNDIGRKILMALLRKMSKSIAIETAQATDGVEAVAAFEPFRPHLVLTDVSMPKMDGIAASTEMRRIEREKQLQRSKIFAITGLGSSDPRLKAAALRDDILDGWIVKGKDGLTGIREIVEDANTHRATIASNAEQDMKTSESNGKNELATKSALAESNFNNAMEGLWPEAGPEQRSLQVPTAPSADASEDGSSATLQGDNDIHVITDGTSNSGRKRPLSMAESP